MYNLFHYSVNVVHAVLAHARCVTVHVITLDMLLETAVSPLVVGHLAVSGALKEKLLPGELFSLDLSVIQHQLHLQ